MNNLGYLFAVFAIVWAGFFVYALLLHSRLAGLRRELDDLKKTLKPREPRPEK